jgi:putative alpha-1,2-mannosidase
MWSRQAWSIGGDTSGFAEQISNERFQLNSGSPAFVQTTLHLAGGKQFVLQARNLSADNIYVTAATLNGKPLDRSWLRHREIVAGGILVLTMGKTPSQWGQTNLPPSAPAPRI